MNMDYDSKHDVLYLKFGEGKRKVITRQLDEDIAVDEDDVATMPWKVLMQCFEHPLTDIGLKKFPDDWEKARKK